MKTSGSAQPSGPISKAVTYELYYTPDQAKHMQASKLVDIERRVASLEALVGQPSGGTSLISTVCIIGSCVFFFKIYIRYLNYEIRLYFWTQVGWKVYSNA